jgi:hypothetical protein
MTGFGSLDVLESDRTTMPPHRALALLYCAERESTASEAHQIRQSHCLSQRDMRPARLLKGDRKMALQVIIIAHHEASQQQPIISPKIYHNSLPNTIADKFYPAPFSRR